MRRSTLLVALALAGADAATRPALFHQRSLLLTLRGGEDAVEEPVSTEAVETAPAAETLEAGSASESEVVVEPVSAAPEQAVILGLIAAVASAFASLGFMAGRIGDPKMLRMLGFLHGISLVVLYFVLPKA